MAVFHRAEDIASDPDPMRKMWGLVLLMAIRDNATSVHYHTWRGDGALAYIIANTRHEMRPPPADKAEWCVAAARSFTVRRPRFLRRLLSGRLNPGCGSLILGVGGHEIEWEVVCWSSGGCMGVEFFRVMPPVDEAAAATINSEAEHSSQAKP